MNAGLVITGVIVIFLLGFSSFFLFREIKAKRKIPYEKLFEHKKKEYLIRNNRFIGWLVLIFFLSIFSIGFLYRITLISLPVLIFVLALLTFSNIWLFRKKYKIKAVQDIAFLTIVIGMGQLSLFLWLNFIPTGMHYEEYRIDHIEMDNTSNLTTIHLEDDKLSEYWTIRTFESGNIPRGDTIVYQFTDGLVGFRIYVDHSSH